MKLCFLTASLFIFLALLAMGQELPKKQALTYFNLVPSDLLDSWVKEWQRSYYGKEAPIPFGHDVQIRDFIKVDHPYLAALVYFLYKDKRMPLHGKLLGSHVPILKANLNLAVAAGEHGSREALRYMLKIKGIDPNVGSATHIYALTNDNFQDFFIEPSTPLALAATENKVDCVQMLLQAGADVNKCSHDGMSPIGYAIAAKSHESFKLLLNTPGIALNTNKKGCSLLHIAAAYGNNDALKLLMGKNVIAVDQADDEGETPFFKAVKAAHFNGTECVEAFLPLEDKINVNRKSRYGVTPLYHAVAVANPEVLKAVLKFKSCDINTPLTDGSTPFHLAAQHYESDILEILLNHPQIDRSVIISAYHVAQSSNKGLLERYISPSLRKKMKE